MRTVGVVMVNFSPYDLEQSDYLHFIATYLTEVSVSTSTMLKQVSIL